MRLSVSEIAWSPPDEGPILRDLTRHGVHAIDLSASRRFPDPRRVDRRRISSLRTRCATRGLSIVGMQSLLFGAEHLNLFRDADEIVERLSALCAVAGALGAQTLTFGCPKLRRRQGLAWEAAADVAVDTFRALVGPADRAGVAICLEPNPAAYGGDFMVGTDETAEVVRRVDHAAIRLQLDVGALAMNGEPSQSVTERHADVIGHVHASEPELAPVAQRTRRHEEVAEVLRRRRPDLTVTLEMRPPPEAGTSILFAAVANLRHIYGDPE